MKKYTAPELEIMEFELEDVLPLSAVDTVLPEEDWA